MNTLGSWIDQEAFTGIAKELAPPAKNAATPWFADDTLPVTRLIAEDFSLPENFSPQPFPGPPVSMSTPERAKVRHFLDSVRHKAEKSGLIAKPAPAPGAGSAGGTPPRAVPIWGNFKLATRGSKPSSHEPGGLPPAPEKQEAALPLPPSSQPHGEEPSVLPPPRRHVPHYEVPLGPLTTRLRALTDWIRRQIDAADIFIIDAQGCPISDREAPEGIVAGALLLAEAVRRAAPHLPAAAEGAIYLDLQDERRLCVIDTATQHGIFSLVLIVPDALAPRAADRLRRALRRSVEAENQTLSARERW